MAMDGKYGGNTEGRDAKGHFSTGNPGKRRGTRHKSTLAALALLSGDAEGLTRKAVELALEGDVTALRLCLERLVPPCREAPITLDLPRLETRADAGHVLSCLLAETVRGALTPGEAEKLAGLVSEHHKAVELTEIEARLSRLEEALGREEALAAAPGPG